MLYQQRRAAKFASWCVLCTADADSAESPSHAARVGARGGHLNAFFSQVKDVASKVQTCACFAAVAVACFHYAS